MLDGLVGLAESLDLTKPELSGVQRDTAHAIVEQARRMNALVNNLLDMARIQSGEVKLRREWQSVEEVVGSALKAAQPALARHRVEVSLPEQLPLVEFDATLIERVLFNLLENAGKYTPEGTAVRISADVSIGSWKQDSTPFIPYTTNTAVRIPGTTLLPTDTGSLPAQRLDGKADVTSLSAIGAAKRASSGRSMGSATPSAVGSNRATDAHPLAPLPPLLCCLESSCAKAMAAMDRESAHPRRRSRELHWRAARDSPYREFRSPRPRP